MKQFGFVHYDHSSLQRLGALKAFVGLLDPQRRSASSDRLDRQIVTLLCSSPPSSYCPTVLGKKELGKRDQFPNNVAEALLWRIDAPSLLFTITDKMKWSRIREWAHQFGLVGRGNQITEKGILLQTLMPKADLEAIRTRSLIDGNPFSLSIAEKAYFLFLLLETDATWPALLRLLARKRMRGSFQVSRPTN